jgi:hypothetical protein
MSASELRDLLRRAPFEPFRIHISDGASYEVRHPEMALLTQRELYVALPPRHGEVPRRAVICDLLHITRIEPISEGKPRPRRNGR